MLKIAIGIVNVGVVSFTAIYVGLALSYPSYFLRELSVEERARNREGYDFWTVAVTVPIVLGVGELAWHASAAFVSGFPGAWAEPELRATVAGTSVLLGFGLLITAERLAVVQCKAIAEREVSTALLRYVAHHPDGDHLRASLARALDDVLARIVERGRTSGQDRFTLEEVQRVRAILAPRSSR